MFLVVGVLDGTATLRFHDGTLHAGCHLIGIHQYHTVRIPRRTADGLDQTCLAAQEAFLVGIQNSNQRHFRQVQTFPQQVNTHDYVNGPHAQVFDDFHALKGVDLMVHIFGLDPVFLQIIGQILRHFDGQRGNQRPFSTVNAMPDFTEQIFDLSFHRAHHD